MEFKKDIRDEQNTFKEYCGEITELDNKNLSNYPNQDFNLSYFENFKFSDNIDYRKLCIEINNIFKALDDGTLKLDDADEINLRNDLNLILSNVPNKYSDVVGGDVSGDVGSDVVGGDVSGDVGSDVVGGDQMTL